MLSTIATPALRRKQIMTIDAAATFVDSILSPDEDCDYLQMYLNTDWESAINIEQGFESLTPELLDLSKQCTSNGSTDTEGPALLAAPSTAQRSPADQLDKRQVKLKQSREAQKRSRERQKVWLSKQSALSTLASGQTSHCAMSQA